MNNELLLQADRKEKDRSQYLGYMTDIATWAITTRRAMDLNEKDQLLLGTVELEALMDKCSNRG